MAFINWGNQTPEEQAAMAKRRRQEQEEMMYEAMRNSVRQAASAPGPSILGGGAMGGITPEIILSATALSDSLEYNGTGGGPSGALSFTVSGIDLKGNITVTAPTDFEVSLSQGSGYTDTLTLAASENAVEETTIWVRFKNNITVGDYTEQVIISTPGSKSATVSCIGKVWQPTLTLSTSGITGLNSNGSAGTPKGFTISGSHLRANATVTLSASTDFEMAATSGMYTTSPITLTYNGTAGINADNPLVDQPITIYSRMKAGTAGVGTGVKTAGIVVASTDAISGTVGLSGTRS